MIDGINNEIKENEYLIKFASIFYTNSEISPPIIALVIKQYVKW